MEKTPLMAEVAVATALLKLAQVLREPLIKVSKIMKSLYEDISWLHMKLQSCKSFLMFANKNIWKEEKAKIWLADIIHIANKARIAAAKFAFICDKGRQHDGRLNSKRYAAKVIVRRSFKIKDVIFASKIYALKAEKSLKYLLIFAPTKSYALHRSLLRDTEKEIKEIKSLILKTEYPSSHEIGEEETGNPSLSSPSPLYASGKRSKSDLLKEEEFRAETSVTVHEIIADTEGIEEKKKESVETYGIKDHSATREGRESETSDAFKGGIFGFEKDIRALADLLCSAEPRLYVVGVVGMGGVGKTALASQVFQSSDVQKLFPIRVWVNLSQNYIQRQGGIQSLLLHIAEELKLRKTEDLKSMGTDALREQVKRSLEGERYLIVMDDMWEAEVWDLIEAHLPDESNKSRIMITTRNENVARRPAFHFPPYRLQCLGKEQSLNIITQLIFENEERQNREFTGLLRTQAQKLVDKYGGSPLALDILANCLAGKDKTPEAWESALEDEQWQEDWKRCMDTLKLSYTCLPIHLKWCFLYLSAFPEDSKIEVERLTKLWVAEGFVRTEDHDNYDDEVTREDIAETYLEDLKQRCLVIVENERQASEFVGYCYIPKLLRSLGINEATEIDFMDGLSCFPISWQTKLTFTEMWMKFQNLVWLRVLDLQGLDIGDLPEQVGDMTQLRYLNVRSSRCKLPDSIGRLSKLESLDCRVEAAKPIKIPSCVWKIPTLTHVRGNGLRCKFDVSHLVKLQTVGSLLLNSWIQKSIPNLTRLRKLDIYIEPEHKGKGDMINDCWKCLQTLPFLKVLIFNLNGYENIDMTCSEEGFPSLLRLTLVNYVPESWTVEKGSMPLLEFLQLESCPNLIRLPSSLEDRTSLPRLFYTKMGENFNQWVKSCNVWDAVTISGTHSLNVQSPALGVASSPALGVASNIDEGTRTLDVEGKASGVVSNIDEGFGSVPSVNSRLNMPPARQRSGRDSSRVGGFDGSEDRVPPYRKGSFYRESRMELNPEELVSEVHPDDTIKFHINRNVHNSDGLQTRNSGGRQVFDSSVATNNAIMFLSMAGTPIDSIIMSENGSVTFDNANILLEIIEKLRETRHASTPLDGLYKALTGYSAPGEEVSYKELIRAIDKFAKAGNPYKVLHDKLRKMSPNPASVISKIERLERKYDKAIESQKTRRAVTAGAFAIAAVGLTILMAMKAPMVLWSMPALTSLKGVTDTIEVSGKTKEDAIKEEQKKIADLKGVLSKYKMFERDEGNLAAKYEKFIEFVGQMRDKINSIREEGDEGQPSARRDLADEAEHVQTEAGRIGEDAKGVEESINEMGSSTSLMKDLDKNGDDPPPKATNILVRFLHCCVCK